MPAKIAIITYSLYGHIDTLADAVEDGVKSSGAIVSRLQLPETLSAEVLTKMHAPQKRSYPILQDPEVLKDFDGFLFGFPTRFGRAPAQVSAFFDTTGGLWMSGALVGKFAGIFTSAGGQHGGHESTALTTIPFLAHHGICYVPIGYANANLNDNSEILGGAPWGASTIAAADGSRQPHPKELDIANTQGKSFATLLNRFVAGKLKEAPYIVQDENIIAASTQPATVAPQGLSTEAKAQEGNVLNEQVPSAQPVPGANVKNEKGKKMNFFKKLTLSCGGGKENYES